MRANFAGLVALILLAGCGQAPPSATGPTVAAGEHYFADPQDNQIPAVYDLLHGDFVELNGSVVLRLEFRDVNSPIPRLRAVVSVEANETSRSYFVRSAPDTGPNSTAPYVKWEMGGIDKGKDVNVRRICSLQKSVEPAPFYYDLEMLNNQTDLLHGGRITRLHVDVGSFQNDTTLDSVDVVRTQSLRGGPNPHDTCPLVAERGQQG